MNLAAMKRAYRLSHKNDRYDCRYRNLEEELEDKTKKFVKDFWDEKNKEFLENHEANIQNPEITVQEAVFKLRKELRKIAHANNLGCTFLSQADHYYISLLPCQIHITISRETGCFTISLPHFNPKQFFYYEWQTGLQWIRDYLKIDLFILEEKKQILKETIYVNSKTAEIAISSIKSICKIHAEKLGVKTRIRYSWLFSEITFYREENAYEPDGIKDKNVYDFKTIRKIALFQIEIYHKAFINNPSLLIDLLENPHEIKINYKVNCILNYCENIHGFSLNDISLF